MNPLPLETLSLYDDPRRLGLGYRVRFSFTSGALSAEWTPGPPRTARDMRRIQDAYRAVRDRFLAEVGRRLGGQVAVVEL